ncbi:MAG: hypothetical protein HQL42_14255, partial [Alphaproteobacteria bacterium]|nr:hypothetical protein [Alphaproteobacteria bacterium]
MTTSSREKAAAMASAVRLMPNHDPHWRARLAQARARQADLLGHEGLLTAAEQAELESLRGIIKEAFRSGFRTTAEYRDFQFARAREVLDAEGIALDLPFLPDDATLDEIDRALAAIRQTIEAATAG